MYTLCEGIYIFKNRKLQKQRQEQTQNNTRPELTLLDIFYTKSTLNFLINTLGRTCEIPVSIITVKR